MNIKNKTQESKNRYYKESLHMIMEAERSQYLKLVNLSLRKAHVQKAEKWGADMRVWKPAGSAPKKGQGGGAKQHFVVALFAFL